MDKAKHNIASVLAAQSELQAIVEEARGQRVLTLEGSFDRYMIKTAQGDYVAQLDTAPHIFGFGDLGPMLAYAHLFTASPEMFEVLVRVVEWADTFDTCPWCGADNGGSHKGCPWESMSAL